MNIFEFETNFKGCGKAIYNGKEVHIGICDTYQKCLKCKKKIQKRFLKK